MNYGPCDGGPWHGRKLAHPEALYPVPFELYSRKILIGVLVGATGFEHGEYAFRAGTWHWTSPAAVASRPRVTPEIV
jgi:hypothetical protein